MMPVQTDGPEDYKAKYKTLKRKLKLLIYENECFQEELRKAQRALLRVRRDKSFLLDRLLQYQRGPDSSSDSEQTEESDTEVDTKHEVKSSCRKRLSLEGSGGSGSSQGALVKPPSKKKKSNNSGGSGGGSSSSKSSKHSSKHVSVSSSVASSGGGSLSLQHQVGGSGMVGGGSSTPIPIQAQRKLLTAHPASGTLTPGMLRRPGGGQVQVTDGQLSREEVERRLAARQPMSDFTTTTVSLTLPNQLFSDNIMEGWVTQDRRRSGAD